MGENEGEKNDALLKRLVCLKRICLEKLLWEDIHDSGVLITFLRILV